MTTPLVQFLSTNGDGTGTFDMATTAGTYDLDSGSGNVVIVRIIVKVSDVDTAEFDPSAFGALGTLSTGVTFKHTDQSGATITDLTPDPIVRNDDWGKYAYDVQLLSWGQQTEPQTILARWTFSRFHQPGLVLAGTGDRLVCTTGDDLTNLDSFTVLAQGYTL